MNAAELPCVHDNQTAEDSRFASTHKPCLARACEHVRSAAFSLCQTIVLVASLHPFSLCSRLTATCGSGCHRLNVYIVMPGSHSWRLLTSTWSPWCSTPWAGLSAVERAVLNSSCHHVDLPVGFADISPASLAFGFVVILHWSKFKSLGCDAGDVSSKYQFLFHNYDHLLLSQVLPTAVEVLSDDDECHSPRQAC